MSAVIAREGGQSSIPEAAVLELRSLGVLDHPPQCASAHKVGDDTALVDAVTRQTKKPALVAPAF
ncbi:MULTISPECIES: hypothetical protein [Bradyrhizobium]|uniref:hypothetical protein n=1 Tax=Bradyrhizobium TaxID=374 RepID=UPI000FE3CC39|nr:MULTISPECIES: hypothetical protein [Bradyrhizobium]MCA1431517.1 hypothetical protein [Bradyrhizobium sp. BRP20]MCA1501599.1 hypothetical protein [Bradyrhizobium sp. NBAIM14]MCA1548717.1 hypothetical protein [Bradyrhizobium sp. BRP19]TGN78426.1 hypothetical protein EOW77_0030150 [Bradyrhizobium yuanmingense]